MDKTLTLFDGRVAKFVGKLPCVGMFHFQGLDNILTDIEEYVNKLDKIKLDNGSEITVDIIHLEKKNLLHPTEWRNLTSMIGKLNNSLKDTYYMDYEGFSNLEILPNSRWQLIKEINDEIGNLYNLIENKYIIRKTLMTFEIFEISESEKSS